MDNDKIDIVINDSKDVIKSYEGISITIDSLINLEEASKKVIEEKGKSSYNGSRTSPYYNSLYNCESDFRALYFFELSDINRAPKYFCRVSEFVDWAKKNNILLSETKIHELKTMPSSYNICKRGSTTIITRCSRYLLEQAFNESEKKSDYNIPTTVGATSFNRRESSYPYCGYDPNYDNDYYSEWD